MLPVLAGWGDEAKVVGYMGILKCPNCRNYSNWVLLETKKKATVFFVPVAKWGTAYYGVCTVCEAGMEANEKEKADLLADSLKLPEIDTATEIWDALASVGASQQDEEQDDEALLPGISRMAMRPGPS